MLSYFGAEAIACAHFLLAHWQATALVVVVILSALNKLLPGHPRYSGFVRLLVSLLAASPMAGARSAVFFAIAGKLGEGPASVFFHWLSTWLDIPLLSVSVSSPGGQPKISVGNTLSVVVLCIAGFGLGLGCASVFGPKIAADLEACGAKVTKDVEAQVAATLLAGGANYQADLIKLVAVVGTDGLICAIQVAIADFEAQHAAEPASGPQPSALIVTREDLHTAAIARGKAALVSLGASPH